MSYWTHKNVLVTGGEGFIGSQIVSKLKEQDCTVRTAPHAFYDLRCREDVKRVFDVAQPDVVFHMAAVVGGLGANIMNPGRYLYDNLIMGLEVMDVAREYGVSKVIQAGTSCAYPANVPIPINEANLWDGYPEAVTAPYGIAKRALLVQAQTYRAQYNLNTIHLIPSNVYGPGDNFNPESWHVIPALITKALEAKKNNTPLVVWGTGRATRDFVYVDDVAYAFVQAAETYDKPEPLNLGYGKETSIRELTESIVKAVGFDGVVAYDATKPEGKARSWFNTDSAYYDIGFTPKVALEEGIQRMVSWYLETQNGLSK